MEEYRQHFLRTHLNKSVTAENSFLSCFLPFVLHIAKADAGELPMVRHCSSEREKSNMFCFIGCSSGRHESAWGVYEVL